MTGSVLTTAYSVPPCSIISMVINSENGFRTGISNESIRVETNVEPVSDPKRQFVERFRPLVKNNLRE